MIPDLTQNAGASRGSASIVAQITRQLQAGRLTVHEAVARAAPFEAGNRVTAHVELVGMHGQCAYLRWSLVRVGSTRRDPIFRDRDAAYFIAGSADDRADAGMWVPTVRSRGRYRVLLELYAPNGVQLDERYSPALNGR